MWTTKVVCAFTDQLYSALEDVYIEYIFNLTNHNYNYQKRKYCFTQKHYY